jgi:TRAP-type C4-dicarboxylate transport system permease small subunit
VKAQTEEEAGDRPLSPPVAAFRSFVNILAVLGTCWIVLLMLLIVADVFGRNMISRPITGVAEVAARSVVAIVFLQIAAAVLAGRMTRADFLVNMLAPRLPGLVRALNFLFCLVGALVFAAIVYASWPDTANAWRTREYFGVQGLFTIPTLPFRAINMLGAACAMIAYIIVAVQIFSSRSEGR